MMTDIRRPTSSDEVRINNEIGGERSRSAVDEDRNLTTRRRKGGKGSHFGEWVRMSLVHVKG